MSPGAMRWERSGTSSPRAGGDEPKVRELYPPPDIVVPAQAGMSPDWKALYEAEKGSPRAGGDEPSMSEKLDAVSK